MSSTATVFDLFAAGLFVTLSGWLGVVVVAMWL
jgi:hypothetical protein